MSEITRFILWTGACLRLGRRLKSRQAVQNISDPSIGIGRLSVRQTDSSSGVVRGIKRDYFNLQVAIMTLEGYQ